MVRMEHAPIRPLPASVPGLGAGRARGCLLGPVPSQGHAGCTAGGRAKAAARTASGPSLLIGMGRVPLSPPANVEGRPPHPPFAGGGGGRREGFGVPPRRVRCLLIIILQTGTPPFREARWRKIGFPHLRASRFAQSNKGSVRFLSIPGPAGTGRAGPGSFSAFRFRAGSEPERGPSRLLKKSSEPSGPARPRPVPGRPGGRHAGPYETRFSRILR